MIVFGVNSAAGTRPLVRLHGKIIQRDVEETSTKLENCN